MLYIFYKEGLNRNANHMKIQRERKKRKEKICVSYVENFTYGNE